MSYIPSESFVPKQQRNQYVSVVNWVTRSFLELTCRTTYLIPLDIIATIMLWWNRNVDALVMRLLSSVMSSIVSVSPSALKHLRQRTTRSFIIIQFLSTSTFWLPPVRKMFLSPPTSPWCCFCPYQEGRTYGLYFSIAILLEERRLLRCYTVWLL
jgi:hypothetical protein